MDEFEAAREDLQDLLVEVLGSVLGQEATPIEEDVPVTGDVLVTRLVIHDEVEDSYTTVEIHADVVAARVIAARMLMVSTPAPEDMVDALGELGNIAGGNVKSLLRHSCRLSLPMTEFVTGGGGRPAEDRSVSVRAGMLGLIVELIVHLEPAPEGVRWPGHSSAGVVEAKA